MDEVVVTEAVRETVELLDAPEIGVELVEVRETITIYDGDLIPVTEGSPDDSIEISDPAPIDVELEGGPASSIIFQDGLVDVVEIHDANIGLRGPAGIDGLGALPFPVSSELFDGETVDEVADFFPFTPDTTDGKTVCLLMTGVPGPLQLVEGAPANRAQFQLTGAESRGVKFGYFPDPGDFGVAIYKPASA